MPHLALGGVRFGYGFGGSSHGADMPIPITVSAGTTTLVAFNDVAFDSTAGQATAKLEAAPANGSLHRFFWKAGSIPPIVDGNGKNVAAWAPNVNQTSGATTYIDQLGSGGTLEYDGTQWWWWGA